MSDFNTFRRKLYVAVLGWLGRDTVNFAPHGVPVTIPAGIDPAIRYLLVRGRPYEAPEADMVRRYLKPGTPVIELGGCVGVISALIRDQIGPDARHIVVEASPELAPVCEDNATRGVKPGRTEVVTAAIDYSGAPTVSFSTGRTAHAGHVEAAGKGQITVPALRLSDLAGRLPDGPFALVSDIEGAELAMFAQDTAVLQRIDLLILETHPRDYPQHDADLTRMLAQITQAGLHQVAQMKNVFCYRRD